MSSPHPLPPEVQAAIARGDLIAAIKRMRELQGLGLKEAKALVDAAKVQAQAAQAAGRGGARHPGPPPAALKSVPSPLAVLPGYDPDSGLAPGEQPRRSRRWPVILVAIGLLAYVLLQR